GTGQVVACEQAFARLGAGMGERYWAGRITLVHDPAALRVYDRVFRSLHDIGEHDPRLPAPIGAPAEDAAPAGSDRAGHGAADGAGEGRRQGALASLRER